MPDTRYLECRNGIWHLRITDPPPIWGKQGTFRATLKTSSLEVAVRFRDRYVMPLLTESQAPAFVHTVARLAALAEPEVARMLRDLGVALGRAEGGLTLGAAVDVFLDHLTATRAFAASSVAKYGSSLQACRTLLGEDADPERISTRDITHFRDTLLTLPAHWQLRRTGAATADEGERCVSGRTASDTLMVLRKLLRWLIDEGKIARRDNPADGVRVARVTSKQKRAPDARELDALMSIPVFRRFHGDPLSWEMLPWFARYAGLRAGEIAQLTARDIVEHDGVRCLDISVRGDKTLKTPSSVRLVPVAERLAPHLDRLLAAKARGRLFDASDWTNGTEVKYAHGFLKYWNVEAKSVGPDLSFHCLRVYFNNALATANVDIIDRERLMGHKSTRTQAAYTPVELGRLKLAVNQVP